MAHPVSQVGVAFVGAGVHLVRAHAKHLKHRTDVQLVGVFDPSDASVAQLHDELGAGTALKRYPDFEGLLADPAVHAVMIGSPDRFHLPQLAKAVQAGKHVFCEKPMCNSAEELETLKATLAQAEAAGLVVTSCHPRRFDPPYVWLKNQMSTLVARYGKPVELKLDFCYHKPDPDRVVLHGGSMLQDHMNHEFDYLNFLFGPVGCTAYKLHDSEDRYHVAGTRDDGLVFSFGGTRRLDSPTYAEVIEVRFERASLHIDTYHPENSYLHDHEHPTEAFRSIEPGTTDYDQRFSAVNNNWLEAIQGRGCNYLTQEGMLANSHMSVAFAKAPVVRYTLGG